MSPFNQQTSPFSLPKLDSSKAGLVANEKPSTGEIIANTYHTYNSIGNLAPIAA